MKKVFFLIIAVMCLFTLEVGAVPACSEPTQYIQPDGSIIDVYLYGDENYHFTGDNEGYMLRLNDSGAYEYVVNTNGKSFSIAEDGARPVNAVKGFDLKPEQKAKNESIALPGKYTNSPAAMMSLGEDSEFTPVPAKATKMLVIGVDFAGEGIENKLDPTLYSAENLHNKFFASADGVSSVNSYYDEVSGGRQTFVPAFELPDDYTYPADGYGKIADGVIKIKLDYAHPDTISDGVVNDAVVNNIVTDAIAIVDNMVDFSDYDTNGVDDNGIWCLSNDELTISFVVAGYEASANNDDNSVWAHSAILLKNGSFYDTNDTCVWEYEDEDGDMQEEVVNLIFADDAYEVVDDRAYLNPSHYAMMGAMYSNSEVMGIGSFCHELGHVLGLPDLYDTQGKNNYDEISTFSIMCAGSWGKNAAGDPASSPTHMDPWSKLYLGWFDEDELKEINYNEKINIEVLKTLSEESGYKYVKVNTKDDNEYYLVENRAPEGYDEGLKYYRESSKGYDLMTTSGIAIWHIDNSVVYQETEYIDNLGNPLDRFDLNIINSIATPGIKLIRHSKDLSMVLDNGKPLWSFAENDMSMFGKKSEPASNLNTYTGSPYSGVEMQFMSLPSEKMSVCFGHGIAVTVSRDNEHTVVHAVNDSDETVTIIPFIDKYLGGKHETHELTPIVLDAGQTGTSTSNDVTDVDEYTMFFVEKTASDTTVHVHNGTAKDINITPIIVSEDHADIYSFHSDVVKSGGCISESNHDCILGNKKYKMISLDLNTLKPLSSVIKFDLSE